MLSVTVRDLTEVLAEVAQESAALFPSEVFGHAVGGVTDEGVAQFVILPSRDSYVTLGMVYWIKDRASRRMPTGIDVEVQWRNPW